MESLRRFCIQLSILVISTNYFYILSDGRIVRQFKTDDTNIIEENKIKSISHNLEFDIDSSDIPITNTPPYFYYPNGAYSRVTLPPYESLQPNPLPSLPPPSYPPIPQDPHPLSSPLPNPARAQYGYSPKPSPSGGKGELAVWCVAKPTVPDAILQRAMDYACGTRAADCSAIQRNGGCYQPNTLLSHASFAFNAYWQKAKQAGGTCDFGGTAMLVTVDPSFGKCDYVYV